MKPTIFHFIVLFFISFLLTLSLSFLLTFLQKLYNISGIAGHLARNYWSNKYECTIDQELADAAA